MRKRSAKRSGKRPAKTAAFLRLKEQTLAVVAAIPKGRVTTYGTIARHLKAGPRQVAAVLAGLTAEESKAVPWFRVVGAGGVVSSTKRRSVGSRQIAQLRAEGVSVTTRHRVEDFRLIVWTPEF